MNRYSLGKKGWHVAGIVVGVLVVVVAIVLPLVLMRRGHKTLGPGGKPPSGTPSKTPLGPGGLSPSGVPVNPPSKQPLGPGGLAPSGSPSGSPVTPSAQPLGPGGLPPSGSPSGSPSASPSAVAAARAAWRPSPMRTAVVVGGAGSAFPPAGSGAAGGAGGGGSGPRPNVWSEPLGGAGGGAAGAAGGAAALMSRPDGSVGAVRHMSGQYATTGGGRASELYNRKPDELDARDIDVEKDAFPAPDAAAPANGHEAIAAMYNFANFRASMDRNSLAGYLAPVYESQGGGRLGDRDLCLWGEQVEALRHALPPNMTAEELSEAQMAPVPEHMHDFMSGGLGGRGGGSGGGGGAVRTAAAGVNRAAVVGARERGLVGALSREWAEGRAPHRLAAAEGAQLMRHVTQGISTTHAGAAATAMREIVEAREQAAVDGVAVPPLSEPQLRALAVWAGKGGAVGAQAAALMSSARSGAGPAARLSVAF